MYCNITDILKYLGITNALYETLCKSVSSETCAAANQDLAFIIDGSSSIHRRDYEKVILPLLSRITKVDLFR